MDGASYAHTLEFLDKHPIAFVAVLLFLGSLLSVVGIPLPRRTIRQTANGIETVWDLRGGLPGIGRGLVDFAKVLLKFSETQASEREQARNAHAAELASQRKIMEAVQSEQQRTTNEIAENNATMKSIAADLHALVSWVYQHVTVEVRPGGKDKHEAAQSATATPIPVPRASKPGANMASDRGVD